MQEQIAAQEDAMYRLENNKKTYELEIDTLRTHLNEHQNAIEQYKKDKQTLYQGLIFYFLLYLSRRAHIIIILFVFVAKRGGGGIEITLISDTFHFISVFQTCKICAEHWQKKMR